MVKQGAGPGAIDEKELTKLLKHLDRLSKVDDASDKQKIYAAIAKPLVKELATRVELGDLSKISSGRLVDLIMNILRELKNDQGKTPKGLVNVKDEPIGDIEERAPRSIGLEGIANVGGTKIPGQD